MIFHRILIESIKYGTRLGGPGCVVQQKLITRTPGHIIPFS